MNPPSALHGAMSRERKPFTYTPGGLDLSEIKSERMAKRLMRNAMNQGVPDVPVQQVQSPPAISNPIVVPNFNCLPVQVFPAFSLPANPKSLLRTRSNPGQAKETINQRVPPPQPTKSQIISSPLPNQHINNNHHHYQRPVSMYEYNNAHSDNPKSRLSYDNNQSVDLPEISFEAEYYQTPTHIRDNNQLQNVNNDQVTSNGSPFMNNKENKIQSNQSEQHIFPSRASNTNGFNAVVSQLESTHADTSDGNILSAVNEKNIKIPVGNCIPNLDISVKTEIVDLGTNQCNIIGEDVKIPDLNISVKTQIINKNSDQESRDIMDSTADFDIKTKSEGLDTNLKLENRIDERSKDSYKTITIKDETDSVNTNKLDSDFSIQPITTLNAQPHIDKSTSEQSTYDEQKEVKVVKKQVKKESKSEIQNGDQNGDQEAELTVKIPAKKSAAKTETKVEIAKRQLPDGSIEEIKTTTTKQTVDGKTSIRTETETTIYPKKGDDEEYEVEEEEEEEEQNEEIVAAKDNKDKVVDKKSPIVENGHNIVKKEEHSETTVIKKVAVVQKQESEEEVEEEEDVVEEAVEEVEQTEVNEDKKEQKSVEHVEDVEGKSEGEEDVEQKEVEAVKEPEVESEDKENEEEEEEETKEEIKETAQEQEQVVEEQNEVKESKPESAKEQDEDESEYTEEEYESEKEDDHKPEPVQEVEPKPAPVKEEKPESQPVKEDSEQEEDTAEVKEKVDESPKEEKSEQPALKTEPKVPLREPSIPLEKVEDIEIKPIGLSSESVSRSRTENTEIITSNEKPSGPLSTQTEYNRIENIVTVNRTTKTLDHTYEQLTQHGLPTVKTYFAPPNIERISTSPQPARAYQPTYQPPVEKPQERRHSLLLERLSMERQVPTADLYQNNYQYSNQTYEQQKQWSQEPQAEVLTVSNVKPSTISKNQQWYQQQSNRENVIYNNVSSSAPSQPPSQPWTQSQPSPQVQPQQQYYNENVQDKNSNAYQQAAYPQYSPKPNNWGSNNLSSTDNLSSSYNHQHNQYTTLKQSNTDSYQQTPQQYSSSYVPPPWEQDSSYVADVPSHAQNYYQPPPQSNTYNLGNSQPWKPAPPKSKFSKPPPTSYIPPAPNQSFVKSANSVDMPRVPGKKTYYSEYERRYITVPESNYIPGENKHQHQPDPSPQYYYDNNEPAEASEPQWRRELREFTEKTTTQQSEQGSVRPPWEEDPIYSKPPSNTVSYAATPTWSQTLRPRSWRERSFESEYTGTQEFSKTSTLGRGRPLSSYANSNIEPIPERTRGVSVDRYNPNNYQSPIAAEHPPVQTHTLNVVPPVKSYHNPNVPAYHANSRASAEPREQPVIYPQARNWGDSRASPLQSRSFKYLQWITGTEN